MNKTQLALGIAALSLGLTWEGCAHKQTTTPEHSIQEVITGRNVSQNLRGVHYYVAKYGYSSFRQNIPHLDSILAEFTDRVIIKKEKTDYLVDVDVRFRLEFQNFDSLVEVYNVLGCKHIEKFGKSSIRMLLPMKKYHEVVDNPEVQWIGEYDFPKGEIKNGADIYMRKH